MHVRLHEDDGEIRCSTASTSPDTNRDHLKSYRVEWTLNSTHQTESILQMFLLAWGLPRALLGQAQRQRHHQCLQRKAYRAIVEESQANGTGRTASMHLGLWMESQPQYPNQMTVRSVPATLIKTFLPPGCLSRNLERSYTLPWTMIQRSLSKGWEGESGWVCG